MHSKEGVISFETNIRYTFTWATRTSVIVSIIIFFDFIVNIYKDILQWSYFQVGYDVESINIPKRL